MTIRTSPWPDGVPCWVDLQVPDVAAAQAFYGSVLGWTFAPPAEDFGGYVVAEAGGAMAAGIGPLVAGANPTWTLYLASADADATAKEVEAGGGSVVLPPGDVGPLGRMFLAADPTGAVFGVWQAGEHFGAGVVNEPGGLSWEDLRSHDPDAARGFYNSVFGYRYEHLAMAGPEYTTFSLAGEDAPRGGIGGMFGAEDKPSHWVSYFGVADRAAAVAAAERGGAAVTLPEFETAYGKMAGIVDPWGGSFWVVESGGAEEAAAARA
jgi:predicted enzyme related to lactoylglutathione lyase